MSNHERQYGQGTVFYSEKTKRWHFAVEIGKYGGPRRRLTLTARTEDALYAKMREHNRRVAVRGIDHTTDRQVAQERRARLVAYIEQALVEARDKGWGDALLAQVIAAAISPARVRAGVFGPCVYCGDPTAGTVDHVVPRSKGGGNDPANLVSACFPCNSRKRDGAPGTSTLEEW